MKQKYSPVKQYKPRYANPDDPTALNYLALKAAILDTTGNTDIRKYLPTEFFDRDESDERMQEINYLRKIGAGTELEHEIWLENLKKKQEIKRNYVGARKVKVTNPAAGTEQIFKSINSMCEEYGFKKKNVRTMFNYRKSNKIQYKGLILEKL
ncbi:hypothetical protein [Terrisporobacter glycolicus]|uniref:hypothetical protein n=1 Tax=Terrisporobacter glycolicus TaxID=36841 RepID=UPI00037FE5EC|nr:hypothetical protein [Terrisporobacter glycolicus]